MKRLLSILLVCFWVLSGCATINTMLDKWFGRDINRTAYELVLDGMDEFAKGNSRRAIKSFQTLKDWYPFSKYAILAELKIADAHFALKEYADAIQAYEEFENLHPRNEAIPYVIYQIGLSYFEQIDGIDRDQSSTKEALYTFQRLVKHFPQDSYANLARAKTRICLKSLAGNEFYIGMYYFKSKRYEGALNRFKAVVSKYPDAGVHYKALQYIARCETLLKNPNQTASRTSRLKKWLTW